VRTSSWDSGSVAGQTRQACAGLTGIQADYAPGAAATNPPKRPELHNGGTARGNDSLAHPEGGRDTLRSP